MYRLSAPVTDYLQTSWKKSFFKKKFFDDLELFRWLQNHTFGRLFLHKKSVL